MDISVENEKEKEIDLSCFLPDSGFIKRNHPIRRIFPEDDHRNMEKGNLGI